MPGGVPQWLLGCWRRTWIKRGHETEPGETELVRLYVQTKVLFADVSSRGGFAGATLVVGGRGDAQPHELISWHAALDVVTRPNFTDQWTAIEAGRPLPTEDRGFAEVTREEDGEGARKVVTGWLEHSVEPGQYTEMWERVGSSGRHGGERYCAARRGCAILVVAGDRFCYVEDERASAEAVEIDGAVSGSTPQAVEMGDSAACRRRRCCCAAGSISDEDGWVVEVCCSAPAESVASAQGDGDGAAAAAAVPSALQQHENAQQQVGAQLQLPSLEGWTNWPTASAVEEGAWDASVAHSTLRFPDDFGTTLPTVISAGVGSPCI